MLYEDFYADGNKDESAHKFRAGFFYDGAAVSDSKEGSREAHSKGHGGYHHKGKAQGGKGVVTGAGEGDAHGKGVYAGCYGKGKLRSGFLRIYGLVLLLFKGIGNHFPSHEGQQAECQPVVETLYV